MARREQVNRPTMNGPRAHLLLSIGLCGAGFFSLSHGETRKSHTTHHISYFFPLPHGQRKGAKKCCVNDVSSGPETRWLLLLVSAHALNGPNVEMRSRQR